MKPQLTSRIAPDNSGEELLVIDKTNGIIKAVLRVIIIKDGEFIVSIIPSLGISGYGNDKDSSVEMTKEGLNDYFENLIQQKQEAIDADLRKHGWNVRNESVRKNFGRPFIDKKGMLQEFNLPEDTDVEEETLEFC